MLRRVEHSQGTEFWLLLPQIEHARLAGRLAQCWKDRALAAIEPREQCLQAIEHHDDGWFEWDRAPQVDAVSGRPLSFMEMPLAAAIEIWSRSVSRCAEYGLLAAHMVSGHFTALLQQGLPRWSADPQQFKISRAFLDHQSESRERWFLSWQAEDPQRRNWNVVQRALAYLQLFDAISLWMCGAARVEPMSFRVPQGYDVSFQPFGENRFAVTPWPLNVERFVAQVPTRRVAVANYASADALAAAPATIQSLEFELVPASR